MVDDAEVPRRRDGAEIPADELERKVLRWPAVRGLGVGRTMLGEEEGRGEGTSFRLGLDVEKDDLRSFLNCLKSAGAVEVGWEGRGASDGGIGGSGGDSKDLAELDWLGAILRAEEEEVLEEVGRGDGGFEGGD